jgi:hypothetical protein
MVSKPVGGRGKKAPYETTTIRVPKDLVPIIDNLVEQYRQEVIKQSSDLESLLKRFSETKQEIIEIRKEDFIKCLSGLSQQIVEIKEENLRTKKALKLSLEKFVQELYY